MTTPLASGVSPSFALSGASHLLPIIGDPVAQVKSPAGMTQHLQAQGRDVICVPMHVAPVQFAATVIHSDLSNAA